MALEKSLSAGLLVRPAVSGGPQAQHYIRGDFLTCSVGGPGNGPAEAGPYVLVKGKISNETFEEWNRQTGRKKLPERVKPKRKTARQRNSGDVLPMSGKPESARPSIRSQLQECGPSGPADRTGLKA